MCSSLEYIEVADGNQKFMAEDGLLYSADGKTLIAMPGSMSNVINIRQGTEVIDHYAVSFNTKAGATETDNYSVEIHIPEGVKIIRSGNFNKNFNGNLAVYIPESLDSTANYTFNAYSYQSGDFVIYGKTGSMAEKIAKKNQLEFKNE